MKKGHRDAGRRERLAREAAAPPVGIPTRRFASYEEFTSAGQPVGGVFPVPELERRATDGRWPARYKDLPDVFYVALPTHQLWCPWARAYNAEKGYHGDGWTIVGAPDAMTVRPSIQVAGWHGYLTKGRLTLTR